MKRTYAYHRPSADCIERIAKIRKGYSDLHEFIESVVPGNSRELAVGFTQLEDSHQWIIKSLVLNDPGSVVDPDATFGAGQPVTSA